MQLLQQRRKTSQQNPFAHHQHSVTVSDDVSWQLPDHVCGTRCQYSYGIVTVSDSLSGCWRHLFGGWDRGALWHLLGAPCINYLTYLLTYSLGKSKSVYTSLIII